MRKKTFDLLCNVGELTGLFQKSTNIKGLLHLTVKIISRHMETKACSIFLVEKESGDLVLRATEGLNPEMIGILHLKEGQGITGTSLKEMRPICVPRGSEDPNFMYVPEILEERYESFLAVPILRSSKKLGVIVMEDPRPDYYTNRDIRALSTIASQLATFLEHARMLLELRNDVKHRSRKKSADLPGFLRGQATTPGISMGQAVAVNTGVEDDLFIQSGSARYLDTEEDFERALQESIHQLKMIQSHMDDKLSEAGSLIFGSHLLMLSDDEFAGSMRTRIRKGSTPAEAIVAVVNDYVSLFNQSRNENIQDKIHDVKDLGHRLLRNLGEEKVDDGDYSGQIVVAKNPLPSEIVKLSAQNVEGFVVYGAGETSHVSILTRSLEVPTILLNDERFFETADGSFLILDAYEGNIMVDPEDEVIDRYVGLQAEMRSAKYKEVEVKEPTTTCSSADGEDVVLLANINLLSDIQAAQLAGAGGVGLYRSEYLFLVRNDFPPVEEQYQIYKKVIKEMSPVFFRTIDIGGDKKLSPATIGAETNPFMGLRAVRYALKNPSVFKDQLKALLRAGVHTELKIMFPLISGLDDFIECRDLAFDVMAELDREKLVYNNDPEFGAMVELPSAVSMVEELAEEADFLSIGTNDLVQYILGVDRTNLNVAELYRAYHPAVLRAIKKIATTGLKTGCPISVCGDAVAEEAMLVFFVGVGIRAFSVDPRLLTMVRARLMNMDTKEAEETAHTMLNFRMNRDVKNYLESIKN